MGTILITYPSVLPVVGFNGMYKPSGCTILPQALKTLNKTPESFSNLSLATTGVLSTKIKLL